MKSFDKLIRHADKYFSSPQYFSKFYTRALKRIASAVTTAYTDKDHRKGLSTSASKSLSALHQRVGKYIRLIELNTSANFDDDSGMESDSSDALTDTPAPIPDKGDHEDKKDKNYIFYAEKHEVTFEMIDAKLKDIIASRGKKSTDRQTVVKHLSYMATLAKCPAQEVEVLLHIISAQFDMTGSMSTYMQIPAWRSCAANVLRLVSLLRENQHIVLVETEEPNTRPDKDELLSGAAVQLSGSLCAFAERLDDEFVKSLQNIDPHTKEYILRLQDECFLLILVHEVLAHYITQNDSTSRVKLCLRMLGHIHSMTPKVYEQMQLFARNKLADTSRNVVQEGKIQLRREFSNIDEFVLDESEYFLGDVTTWFPTSFVFPQQTLKTLMEELTVCVYKLGDERSKVRSILFDTFHVSLCGDYRGAREQLLMSHLQESIHHMDIDTQVLFNRCMAQIGLNSFECGAFGYAQACLSDLLSSGKIRELLAQGLSPGRHTTDRNFEQEKLERRRQAPFHVHINVELLEAIYLVSGMLTDTHTLFGFSRQHTRTLNRGHLRMLEGFEKQTFSGPPEGVRDTIMCATKHLIDGDWQIASKHITNMSNWSLLPASENERDAIMARVVVELKKEALRTHIFQRASHYESLCFETLSAMFDTDVRTVEATVNKLLASGLVGSCDTPTTSFAVYVPEASKLQTSVLQYSENVTALLDANERSIGVRFEPDATLHTDDDDLNVKMRQVRHGRFDDRDDTRHRQSRTPKGLRTVRSAMNPTLNLSRTSKGRKQDSREKR